MTNQNLGNVLIFNFTTNRDSLYSVEIGKELNSCNPIAHFFDPLVSSIDIRANITLLDDYYGGIVQLNPYFALNWSHFPWSHKIKTVLSFGEGFSYASKVPYTEEKNSEETRNLLNFLLFEFALALPSRPRWELVTRIHHRSGVFGLYHANNSGSTAIGLALRYRF